MKNHIKNTPILHSESTKTVLVILGVIFFSVFLMGTVSSFEFDNVKLYDEETKTIRIINSFNIPLLRSELARYQLTDNTNVCLFNCYAEGNSNLSEGMPLFQSMRFKDRGGQSVQVDYEIFILKNVTHTYFITTYSDETNTTLIENKTFSYDVEEWVSYNFEELSAGKYKWRIEAKKDAHISIDWIGSSNGRDLSEWAWWDSLTGNFQVFNITGADNFTVLAGITSVDVLVIAGGGGSAREVSGGGGAGGLIHNESFLVSAGTNVSVVVGAGAGGTSSIVNGVSGDNSSFGTLIAVGGGGSGSSGNNGLSGGSGGGGSVTGTGGSGTSGQGTDGGDGGSGTGGGGGGSNLTGATPGDGGNGTLIWSLETLAGGGGGGTSNGGQDASLGGNGGGGNGANRDCASPPVTGTVNTGGGGGGAGSGGATCDGVGGGSGLVIVRWSFSPTITLNSPVDVFNTTIQTINFNGTITSPDGITNVTLFIDGILNETNSSAINNTDYLFTKTISDGDHNWTYESCNANGCTTATTRTFTIDTAPVINVFSPTNSSFTTSTIFFNATSSKTISTWIANYNGTNKTLSAINTTLTVEDGAHHLLLYASNSVTGIFGLNDSIFFTVDTGGPQITVTFPNETIDFHEFNTNLFINWTVSDPHLDTCWFDWNTTNTTVTCLDNQTSLNITDGTNKNLTFYANDTLGNLNSSSVSWNYKIFQNSLSYTLTSIGGSTESFTLNITKLSSLQISTVDLVYNLSASSASFTSGDISIITKSLGVPNPSADSNFTFYFSFLMSDSSIINTTSNNQTVLNLGIGNCSTFSTLIYNFTLFDEENLTKLTNVTIDYAFNLFDNSRTTKITNFSLSSIANPTQICISQSLTASSSYSLDAILQYVSSDAAGYLTRFYNILNFSLKNSTIPNNISLYDVVDTTATPFQLTFRDSSLVSKPNILVNVNKQFVSSNDFKTVEIPITDTNGQTILNLVINTGIYNLIFIDIGGNIIASFTKVTAFCDIAIQECTLSLNAPSTIESTFNLSASTGISYTLSYTNSTSTATLTFSSLNSTAITARIIGTTQNQFGNRSVCDNSLTSTLGTVDCDTSSILTTDNYLFIDIFSNGNYVATRVININPQIPLIGGLYGTNGFFIAFLLLLIIIILFSNDKQVLLVMLGIGWAVILILGLVKGTIIGSVSAGIWLLVSIVTMLWKLRQEEIGR